MQPFTEEIMRVGIKSLKGLATHFYCSLKTENNVEANHPWQKLFNALFICYYCVDESGLQHGIKTQYYEYT